MASFAFLSKKKKVVQITWAVLFLSCFLFSGIY